MKSFLRTTYLLIVVITALSVLNCDNGTGDTNHNDNNGGYNNGNGSGNNDNNSNNNNNDSNNNNNNNDNDNDNNNAPTTLVAFLNSLQTTAQSGGVYTYTVRADESIAPHDLSYGDRNNITIELIGDNVNRTVSLSSDGSMFTIRPGITLILGNNITLQGRNQDFDALVDVGGGTLIMNDGSKITGNINSFFLGGGVTLSSILGNNFTGSNFIMNGGEISGNRARQGGGVALSFDSNFTMYGGEISGNIAAVGGGGVVVSSDSNFTMYGGKISGNTVSSTGTGGSSIGGGGVYVTGNFTMEGGEISGNNVSGGQVFGGGVYVFAASFTMKGGKISDNTVSTANFARGGGVYIAGVSPTYPASFIMEGGEIYGNSVSALFSYGGGVSIGSSTVQASNTFFTKTGGIIYGFVENEIKSNVVVDNSGTVQTNRGHAVYINTSPVRQRNTTVGSTVNLDTSNAANWLD